MRCLPCGYNAQSTHLQRRNPKSALLERLPGDREEDWTQILEEIGENDNVTMAYRDDGTVQLFWTVLQDD
jgi:hypothetical protein